MGVKDKYFVCLLVYSAEDELLYFATVSEWLRQGKSAIVQYRRNFSTLNDALGFENFKDALACAKCAVKTLPQVKCAGVYPCGEKPQLFMAAIKNGTVQLDVATCENRYTDKFGFDFIRELTRYCNHWQCFFDLVADIEKKVGEM